MQCLVYYRWLPFRGLLNLRLSWDGLQNRKWYDMVYFFLIKSGNVSRPSLSDLEILCICFEKFVKITLRLLLHDVEIIAGVSRNNNDRQLFILKQRYLKYPVFLLLKF